MAILGILDQKEIKVFMAPLDHLVIKGLVKVCLDQRDYQDQMVIQDIQDLMAHLVKRGKEVYQDLVVLVLLVSQVSLDHLLLDCRGFLDKKAERDKGVYLVNQDQEEILGQRGYQDMDQMDYLDLQDNQAQ